MLSAASWLFSRFGMPAVQAFLNPLVAAVVAGGFLLGGGIGWFKAKSYYSAELRVAALEADLKRKRAEYAVLLKAQADMTQQLEARNAEKAKSDARIAEYDRVLDELRRSGKCVDQVTDELLGRMAK